MAVSQHKYTFDKNLLMRDAGSVTASRASQVASSAKEIDWGSTPGRVEGVIVIDVSACDATTGDEAYTLEVQLGTVSGFGSGSVFTAQCLKLGGMTFIATNTAVVTTGHFELPFFTEFNSVIYRYMRLYERIAGTTPSIDFVAFASKF